MKKVVIWIALSLWSVMTVFAGETAYLFSYFINDSKDGLHLAYSYDGLNWLPLHGGRSYLTPAVGKDKLMRDPSICQSLDFQLDGPDYRICLFTRFGSLE